MTFLFTKLEQICVEQQVLNSQSNLGKKEQKQFRLYYEAEVVLAQKQTHE